MSLSTIVMPETDERVTPRWVIEELSKRWNFVLDVAAQESNAVVQHYLGPDHPNPFRRDGLIASWRNYVASGEAVWCNPPYSRGSILRWAQKATEEAKQGVTTVMLLPGDTSTRYFHEFVLPNEHYFLRSRLKFGGAPLDAKGRLAPAKFGSVIVVFQPELELWTRG